MFRKIGCMLKYNDKIISILSCTCLLILFFLTSIIIASCTKDRNENLKEIEIREYQGENLSSVNNFRENSIKGPQQIKTENYKLLITGLVAFEKALTYEQIINNYSKYKKVVTLDCVEGWSVKILWEGVLVKDLLSETDVLDNAKTIIFYAEDGYTTSFPVEYIIDNDIIMAYKMNSITLPVERGFPFQLVAESKWGYKWIKWITKIELSDDIDYSGYWESRGYSNIGDLDKPPIQKGTKIFPERN